MKKATTFEKIINLIEGKRSHDSWEVSKGDQLAFELSAGLISCDDPEDEVAFPEFCFCGMCLAIHLDNAKCKEHWMIAEDALDLSSDNSSDEELEKITEEYRKLCLEENKKEDFHGLLTMKTNNWKNEPVTFVMGKSTMDRLLHMNDADVSTFRQTLIAFQSNYMVTEVNFGLTGVFKGSPRQEIIQKELEQLFDNAEVILTQPQVDELDCTRISSVYSMPIVFAKRCFYSYMEVKGLFYDWMQSKDELETGEEAFAPEIYIARRLDERRAKKENGSWFLRDALILKAVFIDEPGEALVQTLSLIVSTNLFDLVGPRHTFSGEEIENSCIATRRTLMTRSRFKRWLRNKERNKKRNQKKKCKRNRIRKVDQLIKKINECELANKEEMIDITQYFDIDRWNQLVKNTSK